MGTCIGEEKSGFPVQPEVKIWKNRVFEVHVERASITHLITALFVTFCTFLATCAHKQLNIFMTIEFGNHSI